MSKAPLPAGNSSNLQLLEVHLFLSTGFSRWYKSRKEKGSRERYSSVVLTTLLNHLCYSASQLATRYIAETRILIGDVDQYSISRTRLSQALPENRSDC